MLSGESNKIHFHFLVSCSIRHRTALKKFIVEMLKGEGKSLESIDYIFCSDEYLLDINKQFLKHDTLTDIITFEYSGPGAPVSSDIYISVDRVRANAGLFKTSVANELHRVIFHGVLHLCGYGDKKPAHQKVMRKKEDHYLELYFD